MKKWFLSVALVSLISTPAAFAAGPTQTSKPAMTPAAKTQSKAQSSKASSQAKKAAGKTHVVNAEFIGYDSATKTVTLRDEKGQTSSAPVEGKAIAEMAHMKPNTKVRVTCRDNASGEHQAVTAIAAVKSKA